MEIFIQVVFWIGLISLIVTLICAKFNLMPKIKKICEKQEKRLTGLIIILLCPFILGFLVAQLVEDFRHNIVTVQYKGWFLPAFISIIILHHYNGIVMLATNKDKTNTYHNTCAGIKTIEYGSFIITFIPK